MKARNRYNKRYWIYVTDGEGEWTEEYTCGPNGDPANIAHTFLEEFNASLKPGEKPRRITKITVMSGNQYYDIDLESHGADVEAELGQ